MLESDILYDYDHINEPRAYGKKLVSFINFEYV